MRKFENVAKAKTCMTSPKFKIIKDCTTGMAMSIVNEMKNVVQTSSVKIKTRAVKVGRSMKSPSFKNSPGHCNKMMCFKSGRKENSCQSCTKSQTTCIKSGRASNLENGCVQAVEACTCTYSDNQEMHSVTCSEGTSEAKVSIGSSTSSLMKVANGQVGESLKTQASKGKQLKIGGFLVNKEFDTERKEDYLTPPKMNPRRSRYGGNSSSPLAGQGSIQKYLKGRRSSQAVGSTLSLDGSVEVGKAVQGLNEKASTECVDGRLNDQTNQLMGTSLTLEAEEAASQD